MTDPSHFMHDRYLESGSAPSIRTLGTHKLAEEMEKLDIPPIPEFVDDIDEVITVGEFYGLAAGGQIIFT